MIDLLSILALCLLLHDGALWPSYAQLLPSFQQAGKPAHAQLTDRELEQRVEDLLRQMTLTEKIGQLVQYSAVAPYNPDRLDCFSLAQVGRLGSMLNTVGQEITNRFQHAAVDHTRLHIPLLFGADVTHGFRTIFPVPLATAASWDPELISSLAHMAASEARTAGVNWVYSPAVDLARDARWGRSVEGAGEDPYLGAAMARAYVRGYQGNNLSARDSVAATVKHFAAGGAAEAGREYNTADMSEILLRQVYLPPYRAAVEAGAATIMSAFNSLNSIPVSADPFLLQSILRGEWGFHGPVVSDYTAILELIPHGIALDGVTAAAKALNAGVDIDMMSHLYDTKLPALVKSGAVSQNNLDEAVRRVLRLKFALGLFDHPFTTGPEVTNAVVEHRPLARRAAEESFVLLKNTDITGSPLLPLSKNKRLALIGPLADNANDMIGAWSGASNFSDVVTLRSALSDHARQNGTTLLYAKGTEISGDSEAGFAEAVRMAQAAEITVLALGESSAMTGEAASRAYLDLPGNQEKLLEAIAAVGKPVVLLVFSGRPLVLNWAASHLAAILEVWFPGVETGPAIVRTLFGDVSPSGKLTMSFPRAVGQEPLYYNQLSTGRPQQNPNARHGSPVETKYVSKYLDVANDALFPFGYGLSYTSFAYSSVSLSKTTISLASLMRDQKVHSIEATVTVFNTGHRRATEIVQCYIGVLGTSVEQPLRNLKGFKRVTLNPGEAKSVEFSLGFKELSFYGRTNQPVIEPSEYTVWIGGSSLANRYARFRVTDAIP